MKKSKSFVSIICLIFILISMMSVPAFAEKITPLDPVDSTCYSVYATNSAEYLLTSRKTAYFYPYSLIKMMTAIIALENADCDIYQMPLKTEKVIVGREIEPLSDSYTSTTFLGKDYVSGGFVVGDVVSLPDLISAMILGNADDAAMTIAVYIGRKCLGGVASGMYLYDKDAYDYFVGMMNHKISLMGLKHTYFENPTGVYSEVISHSTVEDMARIAEEFLGHKFLSELTDLGSIKYWDYDESVESVDSYETNQEKARRSKWESFLPFADENSEYYTPYCKSIVASKTDEGIFLAVKASKNDINIIIVAMAADEEQIYADIIKLLNYVFNNYVLYTFIEEGQEIGNYYVSNAMDPSNNHVRVLSSQTPAILTRIDKFDNFGSEMRFYSNYFTSTEEDLYDKYIQPDAPILKGTVMGTMDIYYDTKYKCTVNLYAGNTVPVYEKLPELKEKGWLQNFDYKKIVFIVAAVVLSVFILILLISIIHNMSKPAKARKYYSNERNQQRSNIRYYNKKRK